MELNLNADKICTTIRKNTVTSYGLTLVIGLPFPLNIGSKIQFVQNHLELLAPSQFMWYERDQLHATLTAPLRGRYREWPPLQPQELPSNPVGFVEALS